MRYRFSALLISEPAWVRAHYTAAQRRPIKGVERVKGIEPSSEAWEAPALPLSYTRAPPMICDPWPPASGLHRLAHSFVAGLGPAIHEVRYIACRSRGCPAQGRAQTNKAIMGWRAWRAGRPG